MSVSSIKFAHLARLAPEIAEAAKQELGGTAPLTVDRDLLERVRARVSGSATLAVLMRVLSQLSATPGPAVAAQIAATQVLADPQTPATAPTLAAQMMMIAEEPPAPSYAQATRMIEGFRNTFAGFIDGATTTQTAAPANTLASMLEAAAATNAKPAVQAPIAAVAKLMPSPPKTTHGVSVTFAATDRERLADARAPGRPIGVIRCERAHMFDQAMLEGLAHIGSKDTAFVDKVNELSRADQVKLARFIEQRQYRPLGDPRVQRFDGQIVLGFSADLDRVRDRLMPELQSAIGIAQTATGVRGEVKMVVNRFPRDGQTEAQAAVPGKRLVGMSVSGKGIGVPSQPQAQERFHNGDGVRMDDVDRMDFDAQPQLAKFLRTRWLDLGNPSFRGFVEGPIVLCFSAHPERLAEVNRVHPDLLAALRELALI